MTVQSSDEAEIIALIHRNRIAVWTGNFEAWQDCFVHADYTTRWGWWRNGGSFVRQGWEDLAERMQRSRPAPRDSNAYDTKVENLTLRIMGDMAWAIFDQHYPGFDVPDHTGPGLVREARVFERHDGRWKIAFLGFLDANSAPEHVMMMRLAPDGQVLWKSPSAAVAIENDDDLVIRAGRLRARNTRVDQKLQAAIRWAADRDADYMSNNGSVPIVLEGGEGAPTRIWWVIADAGMIIFSFGSTGIDEKRLELAAQIYGLSPAQKQLAALVAEGLALTEIAERMGITANTARTHLNRVFDKTGVRTQPALVRVLLSAAAPI